VILDIAEDAAPFLDSHHEGKLSSVRVMGGFLAHLGGGHAHCDTDVGLRIDKDHRELRVDGREVHLDPTEYLLLTDLARNAGKVLTHRQILEAIWRSPYTNKTGYLRIFMAQMPCKIDADQARPRTLSADPGVAAPCCSPAYPTVTACPRFYAAFMR
jgi:hypothetical protein